MHHRADNGGPLNQAPANSKKVLIVEDEPDIRVYLAAALEDNGYRPVVSESPQPVFDLLKSESPDLIVMDIMMPKQSGISIYKEIRLSDEYSRIPVILISGMAGADDFMESGFRKMIQDDSIPKPEGFMEKPVDIDALVKRIRKLI